MPDRPDGFYPSGGPSDPETLLKSCPGPGCLTWRQREIAALIREGLIRCQIADRLGIDSALLALEMDQIYSKLGLHDHLSLALYAAHHNLQSFLNERTAPRLGDRRGGS